MPVVPRAKISVKAATVFKGVDDVGEAGLEIIAAIGGGQGGADDDGLVGTAHFPAFDDLKFHFKFIFQITFNIKGLPDKDRVRVVEVLVRRTADAGTGPSPLDKYQ